VRPLLVGTPKEQTDRLAALLAGNIPARVGFRDYFSRGSMTVRTGCAMLRHAQVASDGPGGRIQHNAGLADARKDDE